MDLTHVGLPPATGPVRTAGVDLVDVERLRLALRRTGPPLERRICSPAEHDALDADPIRRLLDLAAVFGAKESVFKALGGIAVGGRFTDVDTAGPGPARLRGATAAQAAARAVRLETGSVEPGGAPPCGGIVLAWALAVGQAR